MKERMTTTDLSNGKFNIHSIQLRVHNWSFQFIFHPYLRPNQQSQFYSNASLILVSSNVKQLNLNNFYKILLILRTHLRYHFTPYLYSSFECFCLNNKKKPFWFLDVWHREAFANLMCSLSYYLIVSFNNILIISYL